nr:MAG TPA: hypothetical protein [Bacteriophage sp.]
MKNKMMVYYAQLYVQNIHPYEFPQGGFLRYKCL